MCGDRALSQSTTAWPHGKGGRPQAARKVAWASRGGTRDIMLDLKRETSRLVVSLTDFGVERFDIREVPDVNVNLGLKDRTPGGLGIHLLKRMVDHVGYEYVDGRSTTTFVRELE